jgi:hypothetical protein
MDQSNLDALRLAAVEKTVALYEFDRYKIEPKSRSWSQDQSRRLYTSIVYLSDRQNPGAPIMQADFNVLFLSEYTASIENAHACLISTGEDVGHARFEEDGQIFSSAQEFSAYHSGKSAFEQGLGPADNPYGSMSDDYHIWQNGWDTANDLDAQEGQAPCAN